MTVQEQIDELRELEKAACATFYGPVARDPVDSIREAADTLEKLNAVYEAAKDVRECIGGFDPRLEAALAAVEE